MMPAALRIGLLAACLTVFAASPALAAKSCLSCHEDIKKSLAGKSVHAPVREARCTACHNPHASDQRALLDGRLEETCYRCHAKMRQDSQGKLVHTALRAGTCTQCHDPHAGGAKLLKRETKALCLSCHQGLEKQMKAARQHPAFGQGRCLSCHEAHFAPQPGLLRQATASLCLSCHEPRCKAGGVSIASLTRRRDCTGCHSPHASASPGLLGAYGHQDFLRGECSACHGEPTPAGMPLKKSERALCLSCHTKEAAWVERPNQHIIDTHSCTRCHNPHAAASQARLNSREGALCLSCHADTESRMVAGERTYQGRCTPILKRQCSACHDPHASSFPLYLKAGVEHVCQRCHKRQHRISHPLGEAAIDHRNRQPMQCISCHRMHGATEQFMLYLDGKRALCIECHKY